MGIFRGSQLDCNFNAGETPRSHHYALLCCCLLGQETWAQHLGLPLRHVENGRVSTLRGQSPPRSTCSAFKKRSPCFTVVAHRHRNITVSIATHAELLTPNIFSWNDRNIRRGGEWFASFTVEPVRMFHSLSGKDEPPLWVSVSGRCLH